jgi:hypothetical protein
MRSADEQVRRRQEIVYAQDAGIVDTQRPELIPLELRDELHHRADLLSVRYRQWMLNMGVTYGRASPARRGDIAYNRSTRSRA